MFDDATSLYEVLAISAGNRSTSDARTDFTRSQETMDNDTLTMLLMTASELMS